MRLLRKYRTKGAQKRARVLLSCAFILGIAAFGMVGFGLMKLMQSDALRVSTISVTGNSALASDDIAAAAHAALTGEYFSVLPKANSLTLQKDDLAAALITALPRIQSAEIKRDGLTALSVHVSERTASSLWCGDIVPNVSIRQNSQGKRESVIEHGRCFLMDDEAVIFAEAPSFTGNPLPRLYGAVGSGKVLGQQFMQKEEYAEVLALFQVLSDAKLSITAMLIVDEREHELYLTDGTRILFSSDMPALAIANRLAAVLASESLKAEVAPIEYIDLRFGNKVFYKTAQ